MSTVKFPLVEIERATIIEIGATKHIYKNFKKKMFVVEDEEGVKCPLTLFNRDIPMIDHFEKNDVVKIVFKLDHNYKGGQYYCHRIPVHIEMIDPIGTNQVRENFEKMQQYKKDNRDYRTVRVNVGGAE